MNASLPIEDSRLAWTTMAALGAEGRVDAWTRAYEGYAVPVHFDAAVLEAMRRMGDLDDARSPALLVDGAFAGFAAHARRGDRVWLGGFGIVAPLRRLGLGTRVLHAWYDVVRGSGARQAQLEVLEPNVAARALYAANGFRPRRWLEVWSLARPAAEWNPEAVVQVPGTEVLDALDDLPGPIEPWQRQSESVRNFGTEVVGLRLGPASRPRAAAAVRPASGRVSVLRLRAAAGDAAAIGAVLAAALALAAGGPLRWINVAEDDPASEVLRSGGGSLDIRQVEMSREFVEAAEGGAPNG